MQIRVFTDSYYITAGVVVLRGVAVRKLNNIRAHVRAGVICHSSGFSGCLVRMRAHDNMAQLNWAKG